MRENIVTEHNSAIDVTVTETPGEQVTVTEQPVSNVTVSTQVDEVTVNVTEGVSALMVQSMLSGSGGYARLFMLGVV